MAKATTQSGGRANVATGSFTGAGVAVDVELGFTPRYIKLMNITDVIGAEYVEGMPAGTVLITVTAGGETADTNSLIVVDENGFEVAAGAALDTKEYVWMALA